MNRLTNRFLYKSVMLASTLLLTLNSCFNPTNEGPEIVPEKEYELRDMQYFISNTDHLDTLTLRLQDTTLYNSGNSVTIIKFPYNFSELVKTSQFDITNAATLPADVSFEDLETNVPSGLYQNNFFTYTSFKVPFTNEVTKIPYKSNWFDTIMVTVPARSSIVLNRSIQVHHISSSFTALIADRTTGETYPVKGIWKGVLRYNNLSTTVTQHPL